MEKNLFSLKKDIDIIQTTEPSWAKDIKNRYMFEGLRTLKVVPGGTT